MTSIENTGVASPELFAGADYDIPYPAADGKEVDQIAISVRGTLKLNRFDKQHVAFMESLRLGKQIRLSVVATCTGKTHTVRSDSESNETITHAAGLQIEFIDIE